MTHSDDTPVDYGSMTVDQAMVEMIPGEGHGPAVFLALTRLDPYMRLADLWQALELWSARQKHLTAVGSRPTVTSPGDDDRSGPDNLAVKRGWPQSDR